MRLFSLIFFGLLAGRNFVSGLLCYRCDGLNQAVSDCPGWHRRPVDSLRDLGDRGGLYTHCVDIRLANGTVLYQDMHPARQGLLLKCVLYLEKRPKRPQNDMKRKNLIGRKLIKIGKK